MRTRRKGRWLPKQPRLGARMCLGTFFFTMIQRNPDKLSINDGRMTATHGQKEKTTVSHGKHIRNEWKLKFPLAFTYIHRYNDHSFKILLN